MTDQILTADAQQKLQKIVESLKSMNEEKRGLQEDIKDKLKEAKDEGFDVKTIKRILSDMSKSTDELRNAEAIYDAYRHALKLV